MAVLWYQWHGLLSDATAIVIVLPCFILVLVLPISVAAECLVVTPRSPCRLILLAVVLLGFLVVSLATLNAAFDAGHQRAMWF